MRKCVFGGPSLYGLEKRPEGIEFRPPAQMGDIWKAVTEGVRWIGLIDGYFGTSASVWHKEILYALSEGCLVYGAASMGALRAAECHPFGMQPIGEIAQAFARGILNDDADVALLHGPEEVDYCPFTEPMVEVRATLAALCGSNLMSSSEQETLLSAAQSLHFSQRTPEAMLAGTDMAEARKRQIVYAYEANKVPAKRLDAELLLREMSAEPPPAEPVTPWTLSKSGSYRTLASLAHHARETGR
jgi:hypothetical protein